MKNNKISIIIPVYNSQDTILRTLNSLNSKEIKKASELIIVNDGSNDKSLELIQLFFQENHFKHKIINQSNAGLSNARNTGLTHANYEFIWFIDSDDRIVSSEFFKVKKSLNENINVLAINGFHVNNKKKIYLKHSINDYLIGAPYYIFKRSFLFDNNLFFKEGLIHEDLEFLPRVFSIFSPFLTNIFIYEQILTEGSITNSKIKKERILSLLEISIMLTTDKNNSLVFKKYSKIAFNTLIRLYHRLNKQDTMVVYDQLLYYKPKILSNIIFNNLIYKRLIWIYFYLIFRFKL